MALPPEPLEEVLPHAALVIEAEVEAVLATGPIQPHPEVPPGTTSTSKKVANQTVKLKVTRVHRGPASLKELVAEKPLGAYALRAGNKGPFLLDDAQPNPTILGRYGPDTWAVAKIVEALSART